MPNSTDKQTEEVFDPVAMGLTTEGYPGKREESVTMEDVPGWLRPMQSTSRDYQVGEWESGAPILRTMSGQEYTLKLNPDQRTLRRKITEDVIPAVADYMEDPYLPSKEQLKEFGKETAKEFKDQMERTVSGTGTIGDVLGVAGGTGAVGSVGKAPAGSLRSFGGKVYREKSDLRATPFSENFLDFYNPVPDAILELEVPKKGLKGSELKKRLEANPEIRGSLLSAMDLQIDPQKRYTKEDLGDLAKQADYEAEVNVPWRENEFQQRQSSVGLKYTTSGDGWGLDEWDRDAIGEQVDYVELPIDAGPGLNSKATEHQSFSGGTHYNPETISHTRFSVIDTVGQGDGDMILVEELQSDLLQHGYKKPSKALTNEEVLKKVENYVPKEHIESLKKWLGGDPVDDVPTDYESWLDFLNEAQDLGQNELRAADYIRGIKKEYGNNVGSPPIKKTKESVDVSLKAIFGYAQKNNIDRVVIPPFEKIVEARFTKGSDDYNKALQPNSGFSQTYKKAFSQSLEELKNNYGDKVHIRKIALPYKTDGLQQKRVNAINLMNAHALGEIQNSALDYLDDRGLLSPAFITAPEEEVLQHFTDVQIRRGWTDEEFDETWDSIVKVREALEKTMSKETKDEILPAIEIDIGGISKDYDLTRPRFAKGGAVMQEGGFKQEETRVEPTTGNEVPPGSLEEEVKDDVDVKLSEGEYVIPADVVRYLGLDKIEKMVSKAKEGLQEMEDTGRMGGKPVDEEGRPLGEDEELTDEEMRMLQEAMAADNTNEAMGMADGGNVRPKARPRERTDELTVGGRPIWRDTSTNEYFSEKTVTFPIGDKWYTFPSVDEQGNIMDEDQVRTYVMENGPIDPITGEELPSFNSEPEASAYAVGRSASRRQGMAMGGAVTLVNQASTGQAPGMGLYVNPADGSLAAFGADEEIPEGYEQLQLDSLGLGKTKKEREEEFRDRYKGGDQGGSDSGAPGGGPGVGGGADGSMAKGGFVKKRKPNQRKKPYKNKKRGLGTRP